jgi:hypothetical protein
MTHGLIRELERRGYTVTVHEAGGQMEMHATIPGQVPLISRCVSERRDALWVCVRELAEMAGIRPED